MQSAGIDSVHSTNSPSLSGGIATQKETSAFAVAIGDDFSLRVRYADGRSEALSSGEISIRGLYN